MTNYDDRIVDQIKSEEKSMDHKKEWARAKNQLVDAIKELGFPEELGVQIAKQLGSPKAMNRMISYLRYVRPHSEEEIADEMLAIMSDVDRWKDKKASIKANARYNEWRNASREQI